MKAASKNLVRAFRYPNYRRFFLGQSVGIIGLWMAIAAIGWLLYRLTGDPFQLGLMGFFMHAPTFVLAPFGGVLVDRVSRRAVIIAAQAFGCVVMTTLGLLTLFDRIEVWQILALCGCLGVAKGFEMPAQQALVVDIVDDRADLPNAIALNATIFHGGRLVGPTLAGVLVIPWFGEGACFLLFAVGLIWAIRCFALLRPRPMAAREGKTAVFREIREGVVFAFGYPPVRALLLLLLALAFLGQPYNSLLPVFARSVLGGDSATFGLLVAASGCGAVVAALGMAVRRTVLGLDRVITVCLVLFGIALFFFAQSTSLALSLGLSLVIGFCGLAVMVSVNTIIQALVDDELRGRVMSLLGMVFLGALPLGTLVYGKAASLVGTPATVSVGAMAVLLVGLVSFFRLPAQRQAARIRYEEKGMLEPERAVRG